jgi:hypothetical protein
MPVEDPTALSVTAERADHTGGGATFVPGLPAVRHILIDAEGRQHVLVRNRGTVLQLEVEGADILGGAVDLTFMIRGIGALGRTAPHIVDLHRMLSERALVDGSESRWTARTINRRDACIVHDCIIAGASYREAATVLYGPEIAQRDWRINGIRDRIRRHWFRAQQLISGGYREFLD